MGDDDWSVSSHGTPHEGDVESTNKSLSSSLAKTTTNAVSISKLLVLFVLASSATVIGTLTYYLASKDEQDTFESQFQIYAYEISTLVHHNADNAYLAVSGVSTTITSFADETQAKWPFVAMPHFEARGMQANELSNSLLTAFCPLVLDWARSKWETYSAVNQLWIHRGVKESIKSHGNLKEGKILEAEQIPATIFRYEDDEPVPENSRGPYLPVWQLSPAPRSSDIINYNLLSNPVFSRVYSSALKTGRPILSEVVSLDFLYGSSIHDNATHPHSFLLQPVYSKFKDEYNAKDIAAFVISILAWDTFFVNLLPDSVNGITVVLEDTCDQSFTYTINGMNADYVGPKDLHDEAYDDFVYTTEFHPLPNSNRSHTGECEFFLHIYPTKQMEDQYKTIRPVFFTVIVILVFLFTSMVFFMYDFIVQRRQNDVMATAQRTHAIVSSLYPSNVRDRIMREAEEQGGNSFQKFQANKLKDFLGNGGEDHPKDGYGSKPIADLFPSATVMFADIVGFTAWSSVREPSQVFLLLETIYLAFDEIAKRRKVFKVETIGDCYVAVCGLPDPREDHAIVMARFARDCVSKMNDMSKKLEVSLGPDTGDLCIRVGLNSGPVTAGVLRGEKCRFQLFGDTVNTAARMESNGDRNRVHMSQETVDLLSAAGKSHWAVPREEKVHAKGKGELQTYWLDIKHKACPSIASSESSAYSDFNQEAGDMYEDEMEVEHDLQPDASNSLKFLPEGSEEHGMERKHILTDKVERLVRWNVDVLARLLKQIIARRKAAAAVLGIRRRRDQSVYTHSIGTEVGKFVLDEVKEIIELPRFDSKVAKRQEDSSLIELSPEVSAQLSDYVTVIATLYRDNAFHNFEHASHVTMSVTKLLSRIVAPDDMLQGEDDDGNNKSLHDHTYGITSDPLTQFAVVLSALIHDTDHNGVPNAQLVKEKAAVALTYNNKSVAEQNSVDMAWDLLMDKSFADLRAAIYTNQCELNRFRQLIVNSVMATDICDKQLKELRNARWDKAFQERAGAEETEEDVNRKATIVIEHLIQASDVSHTMQHWHIYRKWNERFFQENLEAYKCGRAEKDPSEFWYKGEIGFFDFYIIPLAKKLKECGVFGVSCDEYLNYAMTNRKEWELKGQDVVAQMVEKYRDVEFSYNDEQCKLGGNSRSLRMFHHH